MHVRELAARFERPVPTQTTSSSNVVPVHQLSGSSVSELCERFEQTVIHQQKDVHRNDSIPIPNSDKLQLSSHPSAVSNEAPLLSAPTIATTPVTPLASQTADEISAILPVFDAPSHEDDQHHSAPISDAFPIANMQTALPPQKPIEETRDQVRAEQQHSELKQSQRIPSEFTEASSTHSQSTSSGSTVPPISDFVPQSIDDVGIIPDVSEGELDDIDGIERVEDYDSQDENQSSHTSSDNQNDTFQRAETLSDPHVSYRTEGGESLHIIDGSYSHHESDGTNSNSSDYEGDKNSEEADNIIFSDRASTLIRQDQSHQTYSGYSCSPDTAPMSSFHTSTIHSQVLFSRATTYSASEEYKSPNNDFIPASKHGSPMVQNNSNARKTLQAEMNASSNPSSGFPLGASVPPAPSPPSSVLALEDSTSSVRPNHVLDEVASEPEAESEVYSQNRICPQGSIKRLPKAKVLIARKRGQSVNLDTRTTSGDSDRPERNAAASADEIGRRRLVREISNPGDFFAGQVSMVQRTSDAYFREPEEAAEECDSPPSPRRKPFGDLSTFHRKQLEQNPFRKRYDEYIDAEDFDRTPESQESSTSESDLLGENGASKMKYRPRMKLFGRKNAVVSKLEKDRLRAKRHEKRKEDIARRSTILSGAIDRVSMAADPWIDFITDAKAMPVPEKTRGSLRRAVKRLFGGKGKQSLIKE